MSRVPRLMCIGNITVDESIAVDGSRREALGGDAIFATLAARRVERDTAWLAPVGNDLPAHLVAELGAAGLDIAQLPQRGLPTVRNIVTYLVDGSRSWNLVNGESHFDQMSVYPKDVPPDCLDSAGILILAMSLASQLTLTPWLAAHSSAKIYLDLQEDYVVGNEAALLDMVSTCDVFLPSEIEATRLADTDDLAVAAHRFAELGPTCVVIKRGEHGCLVLEGNRLTEVAEPPVVAVDPTGAGDAFCGAFAAQHLATGDAVLAARTGAAAARVAISGYGVEALLLAASGARS